MLTRKESLRKAYKSVKAAFRRSTAPTIPVFIFGEMRSGTNMLLECLDRSPDTMIYNETDDDAFAGYALRPNDVIDSLIQSSSASHTVFKALADSARAAELLDRYPTARGVWIYRRYQDVVNSAIRKWQEHNRYLHDIIHDRARASWRATNVSEETLALIRHHHGRGLSEPSARALIWYVRNRPWFEQNLEPNPRVRLLSYENLVTDPHLHLSKIAEFLDLEFKSAFVGHVSSSSVSRFEAPSIDPEVGELCEQLKAELDRAYARRSQTEDAAPRVLAGAD